MTQIKTLKNNDKRFNYIMPGKIYSLLSEFLANELKLVNAKKRKLFKSGAAISANNINKTIGAVEHIY